jgi:uncharacterized phage protein gp47/JayE
MAYGVTPEGFQRMRLPEIRQAIVDDLKANLRARGYPDTIKTTPDSVSGVTIDTFAEREAALWEIAEGVYYAMYPGSASGTALDRAVSFSGVTRLQAEYSQVYETFYGLQGTPVPANTQVRNKVTQNLWATTEDLVITASAAADVTVVPTVQNSATYTVTIGATPYSYTSDASATLAEVLAGLVAAVSVSGLATSSNGAAVRIISTNQVATSFTLSANLAFNEIGSSVLTQTLVPLAEAVAADDLDSLVTLIEGVTRVDNLAMGTVGRLQETDAELRVRYRLGVFRFGAGTLPSIAPNILDDVVGVTAVRVFQNDGDTVDGEGRVPHSIQVVVEGGLEDEIAAAIYKYKGGGIDTNGAIVKTVATDEGDQVIKFDRPTSVYVWVKVALDLLPADEGETFPPTGYDDVKAAIYAKGLTQQLGQDVIWQKYFTPIYQTDGIEDATLTFASTTNPLVTPAPGDYHAANVSIGPIERARFDPTRIQVT